MPLLLYSLSYFIPIFEFSSLSAYQTNNITMSELEKKPSQFKRSTELSPNKKQPSKLSQNPNILKNMAQYQQERIAQSKPFPKLQNQKNLAKNSIDRNFNGSPTPPPSQAKRYSTVQQDPQPIEQKLSTKQTFNQRLNHNIIKDEEINQNHPGSKHSFRIKKVDNRSPKKMRDDLIVVNQQEYKLQKEIVELHKKYKSELERVLSSYAIPLRSLSHFLSERQAQGKQSRLSSQLKDETVIEQLNDLIKTKKKSLYKHQRKAAENSFQQYVQAHPLENNPIPEISSSEEEDVVEELPSDKPRLTSNAGSYCVSMRGIKDKHYSLNMRRTYDVFKEGDPAVIQNDNFQDPKAKIVNSGSKAQISIHQGQNKMTLNQKFKDFLLQ